MSASLRKAIIAVLVVLLLFLVLVFGTQFYTDWTWFESEGYAAIFWKIFTAKFGLRVVSAVIIFAILYFNLSITRRAIRRYKSTFEHQDVAEMLNEKRITGAFVIASLILTLILSSLVIGFWSTFQQFLHSTPFGITDPIFGKDASFFVFILPWIRVVYSTIIFVLFASFFLVLLVYIITKSIDTRFGTLVVEQPAKRHISILIGLMVLTKAAGYILNTYQVVYSPRGAVFGASYTDVHVVLPLLYVLAAITVLCAVIIFLDMQKRGIKLIMTGVAIWIVASILLGTVVPSAVDYLKVKPNELMYESEYIKYNIDYTRQAYDLENIAEQQFPGRGELTYELLLKNQGTISNIRLWDEEPLLETYGHLQELKRYYDIGSIDIDRYRVNGEYRQVMIAAREIDLYNLEAKAQTWVNKYLKYTHGYGVVVSPVDQKTTEGLPELIVKDFPPKSLYPSLEVTRPEIYFGERMSSYAVVKTKETEFNYPSGEQNIYSTYLEDAGIKIGSLLPRLAWSIRLRFDYSMLLSGAITEDSRLLVYRQISTRVQKIAPFFRYDRDPYLVIADGKLYWMLDAYSTTLMYPYAEPYARWGNYIRNAAKVVVDAYTGEVTFYLFDEEDPVTLTWQKIFPTLFKSFDEMPDSLKDHIRYPKDLFEVQARALARSHMTDPQVFYNREDLWQIPNEIFGSAEREMRPYYVTMIMPDGTDEEFILMMPYVPVGKVNMIGWLAARSDDEQYGKIVLYRFPKEEVMYGPMNIEARINQNPDIARELTLWSQGGSTVIRGSLLVIPIEDSILYVEPIYLKGEQSAMPELKRVIVAYKDQVVMESTLEEAFIKIFGKGTDDKEQDTPGTPYDELDLDEAELSVLIQSAIEIYDTAQGLGRNEVVRYTDLMAQFENILEEIKERLGL